MAICVLKSANEANNMNPSVQRVSVFIVKGENKIKKTKRNPKCDRNDFFILLNQRQQQGYQNRSLEELWGYQNQKSQKSYQNGRNPGYCCTAFIES
jgi:hypothetical protein